MRRRVDKTDALVTLTAVKFRPSLTDFLSSLWVEAAGGIGWRVGDG